MNKRFSTNPNYHASVHIAEHYFFPYYPFVGTLLVLFCLYLVRSTPIRTTRMVLIAPLGIFSLHFIVLDTMKRYYKHDPYDYEPFMIPICILQLAVLVASFTARCHNSYRAEVVQRLGLTANDPRVDEAIDLLTDIALETVQTPAELDRLLTKARRREQRRDYNAQMFVG